jgi:DNA-binding CsgD family transcriptional regulator
LLLFGHAAACVGSFSDAEVFCSAAAEGLREQGRLPLLAQALSLIAWAALRRGRWHVAVPAAEECLRLAEDTRQPVVQVAGLAAQAMIAGIRGDEETTLLLAARAERVGAANSVSVGLALVQTARAISDAGAGRPENAFEHLWRIYQVADPAHQRMQACWAIGSLAEVAAQSGQVASARSELAKLEPGAAQTSVEGVHVALRYAGALLADPEHSERDFRAALDADLKDWPFEHGRLLLAYGTWLRRHRRVTDSRKPLRQACEAFDRLGAVPWAERARVELRASGETRPGPNRDARDTLSPQEMQIASLVVEGLGNKEIAQRLYLSPRTIGGHLYRMFPKLGVTSRAQLAKALSVSRPS